MTSVAEAEIVSIFKKYQEVVVLRNIPVNLGYLQPPTFIKTDNAIVVGITKNISLQWKSPVIDMRLYWVRYWVQQD